MSVPRHFSDHEDSQLHIKRPGFRKTIPFNIPDMPDDSSDVISVTIDHPARDISWAITRQHPKLLDVLRVSISSGELHVVQRSAVRVDQDL
jgi:hypothetical protein